MNITTKIRNGGWGATLLLLYSLFSIHLIAPQHHLLKSFAVLPAILVMFFADRYSYHIIDFFAGGELQKSTDQIERLTGEQDFYESASKEIQTRVDDFDQRAYRSNISILSGVLIGTSAPFIGFYVQGRTGTFVGLLTAGIAVQLLSRRGIRKLNTLAQNITKPYIAKYEN